MSFRRALFLASKASAPVTVAAWVAHDTPARAEGRWASWFGKTPAQSPAPLGRSLDLSTRARLFKSEPKEFLRDISLRNSHKDAKKYTQAAPTAAEKQACCMVSAAVFEGAVEPRTKVARASRAFSKIISERRDESRRDSSAASTERAATARSSSRGRGVSFSSGELFFFFDALWP